MILIKCRKCNIKLIRGENWNVHITSGYICDKCRREYEIKQLQDPVKRLRKKIINSMSNHRQCGIKVNGTIDDYLETYTGHCAFCGIEFDIFNTSKYQTGSMDRISNSKVMSPDDIQWLCHSCNATKRNRSNEEFLEYIKKVMKVLDG